MDRTSNRASVTSHSQAERLELAVEQLMAGNRPVADRAMAPLLEAAELVRAAMPPIPGGDALDARLLAQITQRRRMNAAVDALEAFARRELQHPGRLIAAGAVSSAAVGVTVTAVAFWRTRRNGGLSLRAGR